MSKDLVVLNSPVKNNAVLSMFDVLKQNEDIRGGRRAIIANKERYITKLSLQDEDDYKTMVEMAPYYILYPKVVDGFVGVIFDKSPQLKGVTVTEELKLQNKNVDMLGNSIDKYSEKVVRQILENGFCATMNDYSDEAKRPFLRMVKPENVISFRTNSLKGYPVISQFIFYESIEENGDDEFDTIIRNQYTVLDLAENPNNKNAINYRVRIFKSLNEKDLKNGIYGVDVKLINDKAEKMVFVSEKFPTKDMKYFDLIPIMLHGPEGSNFTVGRSPLQDISDMNVSVFQRVVDQTYMLHWTALPTPYIIGGDENTNNTIGPSRAWHISEIDATVGMLEFSGNSARAHQDFIDNLKDIMAVMGAQILKKEGVSRETATSVLVRTAQQTSIIGTVVTNASSQIESSLEVYFGWSKAVVDKNDYNYKLNDDFIKVEMEPNAQIALVKSWLDGAISHETVFDKMKDGEIVPADRTFEEEKERISQNPPPFFDKFIDAKIAEKLAKVNTELGSKGGSEGNDNADGAGDNLSGSNLENGNTHNSLATEQV